MLQEELQVLSLDLESDEQEETILEWEVLKSNLFDLKCEDATLWQCRSRRKGLGEGNKPSLFFFGLLHKKQNHERILNITNPEG